MTSLSTGYTFLNIQDHSKFIRKNLNNIEMLRDGLKTKYKFFDKIFMKVLERNPEKMPNIFYKMFNGYTDSVKSFYQIKVILLKIYI